LAGRGDVAVDGAMDHREGTMTIGEGGGEREMVKGREKERVDGKLDGVMRDEKGVRVGGSGCWLKGGFGRRGTTMMLIGRNFFNEFRNGYDIEERSRVNRKHGQV
jgi:hypothetical protein